MVDIKYTDCRASSSLTPVDSGAKSTVTLYRPSTALHTGQLRSEKHGFRASERSNSAPIDGHTASRHDLKND